MNPSPLPPVYNKTVKRVLRTLLIVLMMLALPAQGMAAASMLYCGPAHAGGGAKSVAVVPSEMAPAEHGHAHAHVSEETGHAHPDHAHAGKATAGAQAAVDPEYAQASEHSTNGAAADCSVCAACCSATGLMGAPRVLAARAQALVPAQVTTALAFDFFTEGPRRPPRSSFA
jgi:hypothetical protein